MPAGTYPRPRRLCPGLAVAFVRMRRRKMKQMPLGIPLAVTLAGTVGSLAFGAKRVHVLFGVALTALSMWHMYQHRKVMMRQLQIQMARQPWQIGCKR